MGNPYEDFKKQYQVTKYLCNQCKGELKPAWLDGGKEKAMQDFMSMLGQNQQAKPSVFYCPNKQCNHFGLLTKVAIIK